MKSALKVVASVVLFLPQVALAANEAQCKAVKAAGGTCNDDALIGRIDAIINTLFLVIGSLAVIIVIVAGIRYITATGDATRIQKAKDTLLYAIIGVIVV